MSPPLSQTPIPTPSVHLRAIDYAPWLSVQMHVKEELERRGLAHLCSPVTLIARDLLEGATHALHRHVFGAILSAETGMALDEGNDQVEVLLKAELDEHGVHNIVRACQSAEKAVRVDFPHASTPAGTTTDAPLLRLHVPYPWRSRLCTTESLIEALGLRLDVHTHDDGEGAVVTLLSAAAPAEAAGALAVLDAADGAAQAARIADVLGYGVMRFSPAGDVREVSASMLAQLYLTPAQASHEALSALIPLNFLNDILWGQALTGDNGAFENYRTRLQLSGLNAPAVLFNVSGFRAADGCVHSLWQKVAADASGALRGEGSILSEVRVLNITRNYVPKLVEQKARDAVRLGRTRLSNEERTLAVLFCDIVGYTSYVEHHGASESVINTLNSILHRVAGSVGRHSGAIDKFMGDSIMALFEDPAEAMAAAIDMQSHSLDINQMRSRGGQQALQLRIGIHWGEVVLGNVGTTERLDWTAIGDVVNTASRIEKNCRPGAILVSAVLRDVALAQAHEPTLPGITFGAGYGLKVKGKAGELAVCEVVASP